MTDDNQQNKEQLPPDPPTSDDIANLYPVPMTGALFTPPPPPAKQEKHRLFGGLFKRRPKIKHVKKIGPSPLLPSAASPLPASDNHIQPVVAQAPAAPVRQPPVQTIAPAAPPVTVQSQPVIIQPTSSLADKKPQAPSPPPEAAPVSVPSEPELQAPIDLQPGVIISPNKPRA